MGNSQSSRASTKTTAPTKECYNGSNDIARGRKSTKTDQTVSTKDLDAFEIQTLDLNQERAKNSLGFASDVDSDSDSDCIYSDERDKESEDESLERSQVLMEAKLLKAYAAFHLRPECPVLSTDPNASGRNYFCRASAPEQTSNEDCDERARIIEESKQLKMFASFHLHPERTVITTDSKACGRNFFSRGSALPQESIEETQVRGRILEDVALLRKYADFHLHPEKRVSSQVDPTSFGRNYFAHVSTPEYFTHVNAEERNLILRDVSLLKQYTSFPLHQEDSVRTSDQTASSRNCISRASGAEYADVKEAEERKNILGEAALHPERSVDASVDPTSFGRNFFGRDSAPERSTLADADERSRVFEELALLKQYAGFHVHPERSVVSTDPAARGRNYFTRASAPEFLGADLSAERDRVLEEAHLLRQFASFHLHPEKPVLTVSGAVCGRNYFSRFSAEEYIDQSEMEERERILEESKMLKMHASFHLHPEVPVENCADPTQFGRNYFMRSSGPDQLSVEDASERSSVLEEVRMLKMHAEFHLHPERPVISTDPTACGRNFFTRASAPEFLGADLSAERDRVLEEAHLLRQFASFHLHPENPVKSTDIFAFGRNFFCSPSAVTNDQLIACEGRAVSVAGNESYFADDFHFDEDMGDFEDFRTSLSKVLSERMGSSEYFMPLRQEGGESQGSHDEGDNEGKLSRSPSSIMLFGYDESNNAHAY